MVRTSRVRRARGGHDESGEDVYGGQTAGVGKSDKGNYEDTPYKAREGETPEQTADRIERKYRARANTPLKAIRLFCVLCMGCQPKRVAACTATECPNHPFRFGKNPYASGDRRKRKEQSK